MRRGSPTSVAQAELEGSKVLHLVPLEKSPAKRHLPFHCGGDESGGKGHAVKVGQIRDRAIRRATRIPSGGSPLTGCPSCGARCGEGCGPDVSPITFRPEAPGVSTKPLLRVAYTRAAMRKSLERVGQHRWTAIGLWLIVVYGVLLYAAFRWGGTSVPSGRFPGSD